MNGSAQPMRHENLALVIIGRNEGKRLVQCLASVREIPMRVYVDSGSTDGSVQRAISEGVPVIELEIPPNFTAARARNAGIAKLLAEHPGIEFVQTIDADCELHQGWIEAGLAALRGEPDLALVFGRLRERYPTRSIYNALCDVDWNIPVGEASVVGGIALFRAAALSQVSFYCENMIAGEEPDLAMRMRKAGWRLRRIDAEMGLHDVDITRFGQWWRRTRRTGHAYAELAHRHPDARDPNWRRTVYSIAFWGFVMPMSVVAAIVLAGIAGPYWLMVAALGLMTWSLRVVQLSRRKRLAGMPPKLAAMSGTLIMIGKIPQLFGLCLYHRNRLAGRTSSIIEHKSPAGG